MLSNRTANFKASEAKEENDNKDQFVKQLTTPLPNKFDMNYLFLEDEEKNKEKEMSSFSFKQDILDKKAYNFIKTKDECLSIMDLDDSIPEKV